MCWIVWEEQTCDNIDCLYRAIGSRVMMTDIGWYFFKQWQTVEYHSYNPYLCCQIPLRTMWMGKTIKLLDFVGKCHITLSGTFVKNILLNLYEYIYTTCMLF